MKREEILSMAKEAGAKFDPDWGMAYNCGTETFIRFAALVAAHQREECAGCDRVRQSQQQARMFEPAVQAAPMTAGLFA